jgi:ribosomal protein L40E
MADFLDKVKTGINKGVATVSTGSKTVIEKSRLNSVVKTLEDEKQQLIKLMGNKALEYFEANGGAEPMPYSMVENFIAQIKLREQSIAENKEKVRELDAEMDKIVGNANINVTCSKCGHQNSGTAKFCVKCGNPL